MPLFGLGNYLKDTKLPKEHLFATVYEDDEEAAELWRQVTDINHNHIVKCGKKDNFWEMGATGP